MKFLSYPSGRGLAWMLFAAVLPGTHSPAAIGAAIAPSGALVLVGGGDVPASIASRFVGLAGTAKTISPESCESTRISSASGSTRRRDS